MTRHAILLVLLALTAAGCAGARVRGAGTDTPSASVAPSTVAGHWQGDLYETGGSLVTGTLPLDLTIAEDGSWRGTIGKAKASGTTRMRGDRIVLEGAAVAPDGTPQPVYFDLKGNDRRRWGQTLTTFGGRSGRASVGLNRTT
jgi:hypothetical protein